MNFEDNKGITALLFKSDI